MKRDQRLQLLSDEEIQVLYARPEFNETQRQHYFALPEPLLNRLQLKKTNRHRAASHLYLILQYGYFKAKHQFFHFAYTQRR